MRSKTHQPLAGQNWKSINFALCKGYLLKCGKITFIIWIWSTTEKRTTSFVVLFVIVPIPLKNDCILVNNAKSFLCNSIINLSLAPWTLQPILVEELLLTLTLKEPSASVKPVTNHGSIDTFCLLVYDRSSATVLKQVPIPSTSQNKGIAFKYVCKLELRIDITVELLQYK